MSYASPFPLDTFIDYIFSCGIWHPFVLTSYDEIELCVQVRGDFRSHCGHTWRTYLLITLRESGNFL